YQSAGELARDIENYLAGDALNARRLTLLYLLSRRIAQHRLAFTAALLAVVLALGGALSAYVQISRARTLAERLAQERNYALYASRFREAHRAFIDGDIGRAQSLLATCAPELRRWEWYYLRGPVEQSVPAFTFPEAPKALAVSGDGRRGFGLDRDRLPYTWVAEAASLTRRPVTAH